MYYGISYHVISCCSLYYFTLHQRSGPKGNMMFAYYLGRAHNNNNINNNNNMYVCMYVCMCVYIYIYREREI